MGRWPSVLLWLLLLCAAPARAQINADVSRDTSKWFNRTHRVSEITVRSKRGKYSRKDNPAVELMKKVIAAKKRTDLANRDFYRYRKYQKLTFAANDVDPADFQSGLLSKIPGALDQIEPCPPINKLILPVTVSETVTRRIYRKRPRAEKDIVEAERSEGIEQFFQSGDILTEALRDFFTDVNIYDDQIRLLQHPFTSPIGKDAIRFYRFYIQDTLAVSGDSCIHLHFLPNNQQDFGFRGDIFIIKDSTYQVKRCELSIPQRSEVNFVDGMTILQEFTKSADGDWLLTTDDMIVELELFDFVQKAVVIRNTRISDYAFGPIAPGEFSGRANQSTEPGASRRSDEYWAQNRKVELTAGEQGMGDFLGRMERGGAFRYIMLGLKLLVENYIETGVKGRPSKVDIGPVNTMVSTNFIDGLRTRMSAQTTANLNPHIFAKGYYARGWGSRKDYYEGELTYSFNAKEYLPHEQLRRNITVSSTYDVCAPTDKFLSTDKDNVFTSLKWTTVDKMMFYNRQQLKLEREEYWGLRTTLTFTAEENEPCGELRFVTLADAAQAAAAGGGTEAPSRKIRTTEVRAELRYAPGEDLVYTKQRSRPINRDAPVLTLSHAMGLGGVLGGQYRYNFTEATFFKRIWAKSWGKIDVNVKAGAQWNQVPFPLLIMPAANLSYIVQRGTFELINNMEFLNDRYASLDVSWDMNGKLFNRLPLIKHLKWREYLAVRTLWGDLTDKNNPYLARNAGSPVLMQFPDGSFIMDPSKPYVEVAAGVHNVFRFFHIEYVRRLTYLDLPTATKHGVRLKFSLKF